MSFLMQLYNNAPVWIQNLGVNAYAFKLRIRRYNSKYHQKVEWFKRNEVLKKEEWIELQRSSLRSLLVHAASNVPHWRELFQKLGLSLNDLKHFQIADLSVLPILEKEELRANPQRYLSDRTEAQGVYYGTSGSTGTPLQIRYSQKMEIDVFALYEARVRHWAGVRYGMSRAMIGGRPILSAIENKPPFYRRNIIDRQIYFSSCHISSRNAIQYAKALEKYRPEYFVGISSAFALLASFFEENHIWVPSPRAVLCSADALTPEGRKVIERIFRARAYNGWSSAEACGFITECECGNLHESPEIGIIEILNPDGTPVRPGEIGELVCTGLFNYDQPLIRYKIGDLAVESKEQFCGCGREMRIFDQLVGRLDAYVWTKDGRGNTRLARVWRGIENVREGQIIQDKMDVITLRIAPTPDFDDKDKENLRQNVIERLGNVEVRFEFVDHIPRNERGKFKSVISNVMPPNIKIKSFEADE